MASDILSQNEIDALLTGVDSGDVDTDHEEQNTSTEGLSSYDFTSQDRVVRGKFPTLEVINERFVRDFRLSLFSILNRSPSITVKDIQMSKYGDYVHTLFMPSNLNIVKMKPLRGNALFVMNPALVYTIVENFFGGTGKYQTKVEGREFTNTEMRIIHLVLDRIFEDLKKAWEPVMPLDFEYINSEVNPHYTNIIKDDDVVVLTVVQIEFDKSEGELHIALPYSMLEPIKEKLNTGMHDDVALRDSGWDTDLLNGIKQAPIEINCPLTKVDLTLRELRSMKSGDVITIDMPEVISGVIEDIPVFRGKYGVSRGNHAVKISEFNHR